MQAVAALWKVAVTATLWLQYVRCVMLYYGMLENRHKSSVAGCCSIKINKINNFNLLQLQTTISNITVSVSAVKINMLLCK